MAMRATGKEATVIRRTSVEARIRGDRVLGVLRYSGISLHPKIRYRIMRRQAAGSAHDWTEPDLFYRILRHSCRLARSCPKAIACLRLTWGSPRRRWQHSHQIQRTQNYSLHRCSPGASTRRVARWTKPSVAASESATARPSVAETALASGNRSASPSVCVWGKMTACLWSAPGMS